MSELEEKLGEVLNNPQMMQQIFSLAQSLGAGTSAAQKDPAQPPASSPPPPIPNFDPRLLQSLANFAQQNHVDQNQQALLQALSPYLSQARVSKLQRAMQAAKMAGAASAFLGAGGLQLLSGR